ncbi:spore coat protein [Candidatus Woesebacteria bacterium RBG_19FT_COMBO_42_9]|uniref:glucose-1-phosphate thymidylyltransferase n=1 Tax=Candidatus Woesebacteria bacterium RBG_16_42_24 TaxID=1802485 RepID=A0A1F7XMA4_9BACT|nr:MAG: spore coat protein [Candidatus Woesebacteria bacterium RBG_16_42_24]OGM16284.1 MAG: spore coat protein [Candidatus Woesebacteria bacterium RBG_19FT_COMBO_42_9]OGM68609.1 MAG: spore coat protein [Candidatus Woesebacteria bacterium RIFCSPLOWO2_01_FULL_43_11]
MKGVITAGGLGVRLFPLTFATNKHLLPVYDKPMIFYPIETLVKAGIKEILIITGGPHAGHFIRTLKNGKELGVKHLEYVYQENEGGLSDAVRLAEDFADGGPITVILGDNTTDADITSSVKRFKKGAVMFLKKVPDPQRYGVPVFDPNNPKKIIGIEEKPKAPKSSYASTGLYIFDNKCFDYIRTLKPSKRGELEITDLQNKYIKAGTMKWEILKGFWTDAGKSETLFQASLYWAKKAGVKI